MLWRNTNRPRGMVLSCVIIKNRKRSNFLQFFIQTHHRHCQISKCRDPLRRFTKTVDLRFATCQSLADCVDCEHQKLPPPCITMLFVCLFVWSQTNMDSHNIAILYFVYPVQWITADAGAFSADNRLRSSACKIVLRCFAMLRESFERSVWRDDHGWSKIPWNSLQIVQNNLWSRFSYVSLFPCDFWLLKQLHVFTGIWQHEQY